MNILNYLSELTSINQNTNVLNINIQYLLSILVNSLNLFNIFIKPTPFFEYEY